MGARRRLSKKKTMVNKGKISTCRIQGKLVGDYSKDRRKMAVEKTVGWEDCRVLTFVKTRKLPN